MSEPVQNADGEWVTSSSVDPNKAANAGIGIAVVAVVAAVGCLVAVAVIGILAAIAIPNFLAMQLRAKRAEAPANVDAIRTAEKAYHAEWDAFTSVETCPPYVPGRDAIAWDPNWDCYDQFAELGWLPDGMTRCQYTVEAYNDGGARDHDFLIYAVCDVDGSGGWAQYQANRASKALMTSSHNDY